MKTLHASILSLVLFSAGCCATTDIIREDYTAADRATYKAIAPKYLEYVEGDSSLDSEERERRARTITTWRLRLEQAETPVQPATPEGE